MSKKIINFDREFVWHPYASSEDKNPLYNVVKAKGCKIYLDSGKALIDGMSSWWCVIHGYNNPKINDAMIKQIKKFSHVMFGGFTHEPAVTLAKKLIEITPNKLKKVFFSDSGSVSIEVAMKFAIQYWYAKGSPSKKKFLTVRNGYHGDTFSAMSVSDPENGMHKIFNESLIKQFYVSKPESLSNPVTKSYSLKEMESTLIKNRKQIAAIILEPILQGAGGMRIYKSEYLKKIKKLCKKYDVLLILDEIATGFGRTGKLFAFEHAKVTPDILCLGKALTGGYIGLAATIVSKDIAKTISNNEPKLFMHGPTFMANPLACAASLASINYLSQYDWKKRVKNIENTIKKYFEKIKLNAEVKDIRIIGALGIIEMKSIVNVGSFQTKAVENGIWIRPFKNLIYIMPPYTIKKSELNFLLNSLDKTINLEYSN